MTCFQCGLQTDSVDQMCYILPRALTIYGYLGVMGPNPLLCHPLGQFVSYMAIAQREQLVAALAKTKFFSIQADGTTDSANIEDELFIALYFDPTDGKVHANDRFLTVRGPERCAADGLYDYFWALMTGRPS